MRTRGSAHRAVERPVRADVGAQDWLGRALLLDVHISSGAASSREARRRGCQCVSKIGTGYSATLRRFRRRAPRFRDTLSSRRVHKIYAPKHGLRLGHLGGTTASRTKRFTSGCASCASCRGDLLSYRVQCLHTPCTASRSRASPRTSEQPSSHPCGVIRCRRTAPRVLAAHQPGWWTAAM